MIVLFFSSYCIFFPHCPNSSGGPVQSSACQGAAAGLELNAVRFDRPHGPLCAGGQCQYLAVQIGDHPQVAAGALQPPNPWGRKSSGVCVLKNYPRSALTYLYVNVTFKIRKLVFMPCFWAVRSDHSYQHCFNVQSYKITPCVFLW